MIQILAACDRYPDGYGKTGQGNARRLRALVLLLRYSGMRIGDAVSCGTDRLKGNKLFLYTQKTDVPVFCPIPEFVIQALGISPGTSQQYFSGQGSQSSKPQSATGNAP